MPPPYRIKGFGRLIKLFKNRRKGFTLAETLITLTIIGVIAALTIPTLMTKYQNHSYVVGLKKFNSQLREAVMMLPLTMNCSNGDYDCVLAESANRHPEGQIFSFAEHFKTQAICKTSTDTGCDWLNKPPYSRYKHGFVANDGMRIFCDEDLLSGSLSTCGVDVNGGRGPNLYGRDIFLFDVIFNAWNPYITEGPSILLQPYEHLGDGYKLCTTEAVKGQTYNSYFCGARVIKEDAMNY